MQRFSIFLCIKRNQTFKWITVQSSDIIVHNKNTSNINVKFPNEGIKAYMKSIFPDFIKFPSAIFANTK